MHFTFQLFHFKLCSGFLSQWLKAISVSAKSNCFLSIQNLWGFSCIFHYVMCSPNSLPLYKERFPQTRVWLVGSLCPRQVYYVAAWNQVFIIQTASAQEGLAERSITAGNQRRLMYDFNTSTRRVSWHLFVSEITHVEYCAIVIMVHIYWEMTSLTSLHGLYYFILMTCLCYRYHYLQMWKLRTRNLWILCPTSYSQQVVRAVCETEPSDFRTWVHNFPADLI